MFTKIRMREEKGFTLIELLIVVAIIGILAAIAIPQFAQYRKRGYSATVKSDLKNMYTSAQAYLTESGHSTITDWSVLTNFGYKKSTDITPLGAMSATAGSWRATSTKDTTIVGTIDSAGVITGSF